MTIYCLRPQVTNQLAVLYPVAHLTTSAPKGGTVYELIGRVPDVTMTSRLVSNTSFPPSFLWSPGLRQKSTHLGSQFCDRPLQHRPCTSSTV